MIYILYIVHCTLYTVHYTMYNIQYIIRYRWYSIYRIGGHRTRSTDGGILYTVQCTLYTVHNAYCIASNTVHCTVYTVHCAIVRVCESEKNTYFILFPSLQSINKKCIIRFVDSLNRVCIPVY